MKLPLYRIAALALTVALIAPVSAVTLYDPAGGLPSNPPWTTYPVCCDSIVSGLLRIDTDTLGLATQHGHGRSSPIDLDTAAGFSLSFGLRVNSESHSSGDRAGFSLLVQGLDESKAIQLSFWSNAIWASDALFVKAESVVSPLVVPTVFQTYTLQVAGNAYTLSSTAAAGTLLSGSLRDYPVAAHPIYGASNVIWFGDNTSSAKAIVDIGAITLTPIPEPASALMLLAGLAGIGAFAARRRA